MKKGFTLIELLAVIVILAIVALITIPVITNLIKEFNENAFLETGNSLVNAAKTYQTEAAGNNESLDLIVDYEKNINTDKLKLKGDLPDSGTMKLYEDGKIEFKLWSNKVGICIEKNIDSKKIEKSKYLTKDNCKL